MPLLTESARNTLQQEAENFRYQPEIKTVGTGDRIVRTEYSAFSEFPAFGWCEDFGQAFQSLIDDCNQLEPYPFMPKLQFNEMVLQRYLPGQLGITPHRDSLRAINLIALVNLGGQADFYRCDDRQGTNAVQLDTTPGNVIFWLLRGSSIHRCAPFIF